MVKSFFGVGMIPDAHHVELTHRMALQKLNDYRVKVLYSVFG